ncbi:MAG: hypothetical protein IPI35_27285 [Deltaproteobacteria bacterium]|nr:hypothetical protein [Deltaproteobacteria bacterium]
MTESLSTFARLRATPPPPVQSLVNQLIEDRDLVGAWMLLTAAQPLVNPASPLAGADLSWWATLSVSITAALRGRALGEGPHPALAPQRTFVGQLALRAAMALVPWTLLAWAELGRTIPVKAAAEPSLAAVVAPALTLALLGLRWLSWREGRTAWLPHARVSPLVWAVLLAAVPVVMAFVLGVVCAALPPAMGAPTFTASLIGLGFVSAALFAGRIQHVLQRRAAGYRDGEPWRPRWFRFGLALLGPPAGVLIAVVALAPAAELGLGLAVGGDQAYIVALYVLAWGRVLWPRPLPLARTVVLHEVVPTGGGDSSAETLTARAFSEIPSGSLRINPLRLRRTRVMHPWVVPVMRPGLSEEAQALASPWPIPPAPAPLHALGEARFEPDPVLGRAQLDEITLRMQSHADDNGVDLREDGLTRRIVVLRAFPSGPSQSAQSRTFSWDDTLPEASAQVIDNRTTQATLRDRDVILIASGGRARLFEVELGATTSDPFLFELGRAPQIEDYVRVAT